MRNAFFVRRSGSRSGHSQALKVDRINNIRVMVTGTRELEVKNMPLCEIQALSFGKRENDRPKKERSYSR